MFVLFMNSNKLKKKMGTKGRIYPESEGWNLTE